MSEIINNDIVLLRAIKMEIQKIWLYTSDMYLMNTTKLKKTRGNNIEEALWNIFMEDDDFIWNIQHYDTLNSYFKLNFCHFDEMVYARDVILRENRKEEIISTIKENLLNRHIFIWKFI